MKNSMKELTLNEMEQVNGGFIFVIYEGSAGGFEFYRYEIISDKTGNVLDVTDDLAKAEFLARALDQTPRVIDWETLENLRKASGVI